MIKKSKKTGKVVEFVKKLESLQKRKMVEVFSEI